MPGYASNVRTTTFVISQKPEIMAKNKTIQVKGVEINIISQKGIDYISLTDMLKAKDGDFFISDWLRNRNTVEFLGIWESIYNPDFNYGEFAIIKSKIAPLKELKPLFQQAFVQFCVKL